MLITELALRTVIKKLLKENEDDAPKKGEEGYGVVTSGVDKIYSNYVDQVKATIDYYDLEEDGGVFSQFILLDPNKKIRNIYMVNEIDSKNINKIECFVTFKSPERGGFIPTFKIELEAKKNQEGELEDILIFDATIKNQREKIFDDNLKKKFADYITEINVRKVSKYAVESGSEIKETSHRETDEYRFFYALKMIMSPEGNLLEDLSSKTKLYTDAMKNMTVETVGFPSDYEKNKGSPAQQVMYDYGYSVGSSNARSVFGKLFRGQAKGKMSDYYDLTIRAIEIAAKLEGIDPVYLYSMAAIESGGNPLISKNDVLYTGLFQFGTTASRTTFPDVWSQVKDQIIKKKPKTKKFTRSSGRGEWYYNAAKNLLDFDIIEEYSTSEKYKAYDGKGNLLRNKTRSNMMKAIKKGELDLIVSDDQFQKIINNAIACCRLIKANFKSINKKHHNFVGAYTCHQQGTSTFNKMARGGSYSNMPLIGNARGNIGPKPLKKAIKASGSYFEKIKNVYIFKLTMWQKLGQLFNIESATDSKIVSELDKKNPKLKIGTRIIEKPKDGQFKGYIVLKPTNPPYVLKKGNSEYAQHYVDIENYLELSVSGKKVLAKSVANKFKQVIEKEKIELSDGSTYNETKSSKLNSLVTMGEFWFYWIGKSRGLFEVMEKQFEKDKKSLDSKVIVTKK